MLQPCTLASCTALPCLVCLCSSSLKPNLISLAIATLLAKPTKVTLYKLKRRPSSSCEVSISKSIHVKRLWWQDARRLKSPLYHTSTNRRIPIALARVRAAGFVKTGTLVQHHLPIRHLLFLTTAATQVAGSQLWTTLDLLLYISSLCYTSKHIRSPVSPHVFLWTSLHSGLAPP